MVSIKSVDEIILNLIDFFKLVQPELDTKPGTVARDLFIEAPASQLSLLYDELATISNSQSIRLVSGSDLDKLAKNFGAIRNSSTYANGVVLFTFSSINSNFNIKKGSLVTATNGATYTVNNNIFINSSSLNYYKSIALKFKSELNAVGISDIYAVEANVTATSGGSSGNIGKYGIVRANISGVSNVTNVIPFTGGSDQETDTLFRNRVLSIFSGSSIGTSLGYKNIALATSGVVDAAVIQPGSVLMTRDGTIIERSNDGTIKIISEGAGGKVDISILGQILQQNTDSFIYIDKSNNNDPSNIKNNYIIGQILADENKSVSRKRIDNIASGILPQQPVNDIVQVIGSISGTNFIEKSVDEYGRISGNYELVKDSSIYQGSPWGFDTFRWISNKISLFKDNLVKGQLNSQDPTTYNGILDIPKIEQNINITNENSQITPTDRSIIQLLHTPAISVTRVFNVNTGERYLVANQNLDNTPNFNSTGRIKISGNTLPSPTDILQVDYTWIVNYDCHSDYDGLNQTSNLRPVADSIDWGYSSLIRSEKIKFNLDSNGNFFTGRTSLNINSVLFANKFEEVDCKIEKELSGIFTERLFVNLEKINYPVSNIKSIKIKNTNIEIYNTNDNNSVIKNTAFLFGAKTYYDCKIILPTDIPENNQIYSNNNINIGDYVTVIYNTEDVFNYENSVGSFSGNQIIIPANQINTSATSIFLDVAYYYQNFQIYSSGVPSLPVTKLGNGFSPSQNIQPLNNKLSSLKKENKNIQLNSSNQYYIELDIDNNNYLLEKSLVVSVIRLSDAKELWNSDNIGNILISPTGKYQLILSGYNNPTTNDSVFVIYFSNDIQKFQPFQYQNNILNYFISNTNINILNNNYYFSIDPFKNLNNSESIDYAIIESNTNINFYPLNGFAQANISKVGNKVIITDNNISQLLSQYPQNYFLNKKIIISNSNYNGIYNILDIVSNELVISSIFEKISKNQICVYRLRDGKDFWSENISIDSNSKIVNFPLNTPLQINEKLIVVIFNIDNINQSPTRLSSSINDQTINPGTISIAGTTINKVENYVFTVGDNGLKLNLSKALRKYLNLNSTTSIPQNIKLSKIIKLEKVETVSSNNDEILQVISSYDLKNIIINDNSYYMNSHLSDNELGNLDFIIPPTKNNISNIPKTGDKIRVSFYYQTPNDYENLTYTLNGTLYTNKKFASIDKIYVNSGFRNSLSTKLLLTTFNQPTIGSRYSAYYDYTAPKQNERISIIYNYNKLISDVTFNVENNRPINSDVLVKEAKKIPIDLTLNVVISDSYLSSTSSILTNIKDKLVNTLNFVNLGGIIDQATLLSVAQSVVGVARARIVYLNISGNLGQVSKITANDNEYFISNNIIVNAETR